MDEDLNKNLNINDIYKENIYKNNNYNHNYYNEKYSDSEDLDNNLKKRSLKTEDFNFDDSNSKVNSEENKKTIRSNKNNDGMDEFDNNFYNHEKFFSRMKKLFDD